MLAEVEKLKLKMLSMISKESDFQRMSLEIKIAVHFLSIFLHQKRNLKYFFFHNFPCIFPNILSLFQDYFFIHVSASSFSFCSFSFSMCSIHLFQYSFAFSGLFCRQRREHSLAFSRCSGLFRKIAIRV